VPARIFANHSVSKGNIIGCQTRQAQKIGHVVRQNTVFTLFSKEKTCLHCVIREGAEMRSNFLITVLALLLLSGIVGAASYQYRSNEKLFLSYFQEHQFLHADHLSDQIKKLLWG
jgi:hypothetical protein